MQTRSLNPVIQQEKTGCGIASVAALAGVSYDRARAKANQLGIFAADPKLWSETAYVRSLLASFEISVAERERPFVSWEEMPGLALLAVKWHLEKGKPFWHWVVYVRDEESSYVLDPKKGLKKNQRTDFGRIKPKWFIEVKG